LSSELEWRSLCSEAAGHGAKVPVTLIPKVN
jgi:hypothetical protein